ncbi:MFS transporter [uncultured Catenibacterium sp.]|uniref:MFS transporter n=1 Tax=uncultured Catenibacterium sp. TaxID=286142 RepID=UPI0025FC1F27|nr:MFS transporter [uncultured Catenibacterium sp.]
MEQSKSINIKYSMLQGIYFVGFCTVMGYAAVYLGSIGMSSSLIGIVLAIANILTSIAQPVLGGFVDKSNVSMKKVLMIMFGMCSILSVLLMLASKVTFLAAALFIAVSTILYTTMPLVNSLAFAFQKQGIDVKFGVARGIGSVAYALASLVLGNIVKAVSPTLMPLAYIVIFLGILPLIRSFKMPEAEIDEVIEEKVVEKENTGAFIKKHLKFMIFLAGFVLVYFDHTIINNFFISVIENVGGNTGDMGNAVFLAAMLELPTMALFEKYKNKINIKNTIVISAVFFTIKHTLTYFATSMFMIYLAQATQMLAYALFIPASVYYVDKLFDAKDAVKGQALVTTSMTVSGVLASFLGGILLDNMGVYETLFLGLVLSVIGTIVMIVTVENVNKKGA